MKASFRDKYISICEDTLQAPDRGVVKGVLLSHLKMDVCPVLETGKSLGSSGKHTKSEKKSRKNDSMLHRKGCVRASDKRSRSDKERGIEYFERRISDGQIELMSRDGYLIPEEVKKDILQSRKESMGKNRSLPREMFVNDDRESLGTLITVSYRDSKRKIVIDKNGPVHEYLKVSRPPAYEDEEESPYSVVGEFKKTESLPKYYIIDEGVDGYCMHDLKVRDCWECESVYSEASMSSALSLVEGKSNNSYKGVNHDWIPSEYLKCTLKQQDSEELSDLYLKQSLKPQHSLDSTVSQSSSVETNSDERFYYGLEEIEEEKRNLDEQQECNEDVEIFV